MRKIFLLNLYAFLFWLLALSLSGFNLSVFRYLRSFSSLIITLALVGFNLTVILQLFRRKEFSKIEILSVASVLALLAAPFLITLEYTFFKLLSPNLPFLNSLAIFVLFTMAYYLKKNKPYLENFNFLNFKIEKGGFLKLIKSPLLIASIILSATIAITFSAFYALPELDPYYWYLNFQKMIAAGSITPLSGYRPFFMSLLYILNQSSEIDLYAVFKYVVPSLSLLVIIPAWLAAQNQKSHLKQFALLLVPFINASAFLYSQIPIPQAILIILLNYFVFFLLYAWIAQDSLFYFLSAVIIFFAYFYHESAALIFLVWFAIALLFHGKIIIKMAKKNALVSFFTLAGLIYFLLPLAKSSLSFIYYNFKKIPPPGSYVGVNFLFPAKYVNIDGILMGWGNSAGTLKYYAYYAGSAFFILFFYVIYLFLRDLNFRKFAKKFILSREIATLVAGFLLFFSISEVLPRFFNIAFLPERSWIFGGIFSIVFLFLIFRYKKKRRLLGTLVIISLFINLGGALYINNLKKNMITSGNLASAEWIKKNLPENRLIFSNISWNAMALYSASETVGVPNEFYFDPASYQKGLAQFKNDINSRNLYAYYSKISEKNPYLGRPYYKIPNQPRDFIFDKYPDQFQRIYFDPENNIIIWKILK